MITNKRPAALLLLTLLVLAAACASGGQRSATSNSSLVTAEDIAKYPNEPIEMIIARKVPGVTASRDSDGDIILVIRGAASVMNQPRPPLFVLNDIPLLTRTNALANIDPLDIASISVLKGTEAALYGIDGADGVVVVKTKMGGARKSN
jgi:TonB-dependent SusC/RagA subfamily outer membrane receptor